MAQNLPFSVANILRSDFPHPSRISRTPRVLYVPPCFQEAANVPFVAGLRCELDQRMKCGQAGCFSYSGAPPIFSRPEKDTMQSSTQRRRRQGKTNSSETQDEGNIAFKTHPWTFYLSSLH